MLEHLSLTEQKHLAQTFSTPGSINMEHLQASKMGRPVPPGQLAPEADLRSEEDSRLHMWTRFI